MRLAARSNFKNWWHAPITRRDRALGVFVGVWAGLWIGALGRIFLGPLPVSLDIIAGWCCAASAVCAVLGACFPKVVTAIGLPFAMFSF